MENDPSIRLSEEDGRSLVKAARSAIESELTKAKVDNVPIQKFSERRGVFVTLKKNGELRGCIGFPEPVYPLKKAIVMAAKAAAFEDPRFGPLTIDELPELELEISVLTMPKLIEIDKPEDYLEKVIIGRDGLIIRHMYSSGLLLPQVFVEHHCDAKAALEILCRKAGLDPDAWMDDEAVILSFEAQVFNE